MPKPLPSFHELVRVMRAIGPQQTALADYAARFWSDERLEDAERDGDLPGRPGEVKPKASPLQ